MHSLLQNQNSLEVKKMDYISKTAVEIRKHKNWKGFKYAAQKVSKHVSK